MNGLRAKYPYTTKEVCELVGIISQRLWLYRKGDNQSYKDKKYFYPPVLIEGEDYQWYKGKVFYSDSAIKKINQKQRS